MVLCVGGLLAWVIDGCSNKDVDRSESKTLDKTAICTNVIAETDVLLLETY